MGFRVSACIRFIIRILSLRQRSPAHVDPRLLRGTYLRTISCDSNSRQSALENGGVGVENDRQSNGVEVCTNLGPVIWKFYEQLLSWVRGLWHVWHRLPHTVQLIFLSAFLETHVDISLSHFQVDCPFCQVISNSISRSKGVTLERGACDCRVGIWTLNRHGWCLSHSSYYGWGRGATASELVHVALSRPS